MSLPSKTFLIGEYAVLNKGAAIILNTKPRFEMQNGKFCDPHHSKGGFGASSAAWIFKNKIFDKNPKTIISKYVKDTWSGVGIPPSGVDVISQMVGKVFSIDLSSMKITSDDWNFYDFFIVRTGNKIPTYKHLEQLDNVDQFGNLTELSRKALALFIKKDKKFFEYLKQFDQELARLNLCLNESAKLKKKIMKMDGVVYTRACGAMGADTIIVFILPDKNTTVEKELLKLNLDIVATQNDICEGMYDI